MSRKRSLRRKRAPAVATFPESWLTKKVVLSAVLIAVTAVAYIPLLSNSFIDYDDPDYITQNPHVTAGLTIDTWKWAWTSTRSSNWHPLTWISHAADVEMFGLDPGGHHLTSLLLHIVNALLFFLLLSGVTANWFRCFVPAAFFAMHPLAVESVAWAAERKNVLCTLFFLLAIAAYAAYTRRPGVGRYVLVVLSFALALCSKPMAITLPFVLLLLDFWPLGRVGGSSAPTPLFPAKQFRLKNLVAEKIPLLAMAVCSAIITFSAQSAGGAVSPMTSLSIGRRMANAVHSYFAYLVHVIWPADLVPFYPPVSVGWLELGVATTVVLFLSSLFWRLRMERPYLILGWLFYLGTLVPVIGLVQVGSQAMADRYMYIPLLGVLVAAIWLIEDIAVARKWQRISWVPVALILVILGTLTWRQVGLWHDDIALWSYNLKRTPNNVVAEDNLGIALLQEGRTSDALPHFYNAARLDPGDPISAVNVATDLLSQGATREAIAKYEAALPRAAIIPMLEPNIHSNLGSALLSLGDVEQARQHYKAALRLNPNDQIAGAGLQRIDQLEGAGELPANVRPKWRRDYEIRPEKRAKTP